jgi:hypothetical protein
MGTRVSDDSSGEEPFDDSLEHLLERSEKALKDASDNRVKLCSFTHTAWRRLLGDQLEEMMLSREKTEQRVYDSDPTIRCGAFSLIAHHWGPTVALLEVYQRVAVFDPDAEVRSAAISCLAGLYKNKANGQVCALLARIVCDSVTPANLQSAAYLGFLLVAGATISPELDFAILQGENIKRYIDWELIRSMLD